MNCHEIELKETSLKSHQSPYRAFRHPLCYAAVSIAACVALASTGCSKAPSKLKVAYLGLTCEAPIFAAYEKGFFKDEGLDVELVKTDWDGLREGLGLGKFDANHHLLMFLLRPIAQGLDIKITGGIHTGCLRVQASAKSTIMSVEDLKGKKIGVPNNLGSPPAMFAKRVIAAHGLDPEKKEDVEFVALAPEAMGIAIDKGQVDAVATSEPMGTIFTGKNLVRTISDQAVDAPYKDEYCCVSLVSGKLARENPEAASKVTRALLKGAKWVQTNPTAAANLAVEKKYVASTPELNAQALAKLNYIPGIARCRDSLVSAATEMKAAKFLDAKVDVAELAKKAWIDLPGVNDEWIKNLQVEKVVGGGPPPRLTPEMVAALFDGKEACCSCCCAPKAGADGKLTCP